MRKQPGLLEDPDCHRADVGEGGVVAPLVQPGPGLGPAVLGPIAEGGQRLQAAHLATASGQVEDLVRGEVHRVPGAGELARRLDERAVVAAVPAQPGDGDEHLGGVRHHVGTSDVRQPRVTDPGSGRTEPVRVLTGGRQQDGRLGDVQHRATLGAGERPAYLMCVDLGHLGQCSTAIICWHLVVEHQWLRLGHALRQAPTAVCLHGSYVG